MNPYIPTENKCVVCGRPYGLVWNTSKYPNDWVHLNCMMKPKQAQQDLRVEPFVENKNPLNVVKGKGEGEGKFYITRTLTSVEIDSHEMYELIYKLLVAADCDELLLSAVEAAKEECGK